MAIEKELMDILCCPKCKGSLNHQQKPPSFVCEACQLRYAIVNDIPNFLINEAKPLNEAASPLKK